MDTTEKLKRLSLTPMTDGKYTILSEIDTVELLFDEGVWNICTVPKTGLVDILPIVNGNKKAWCFSSDVEHFKKLGWDSDNPTARIFKKPNKKL